MSIPLPPVTAKEHAYSFEEHYIAVATDGNPGVPAGTLVASEVTVGTTYWSWAAQSMHGIVSSSDGLARVTVTNFTNTESGSLVADLTDVSCTLYPVEGGTSFTSYTYWRDFVANALAANISVAYWTDPAYSYDNTFYGPIDFWSGTPPTGDPGRSLTYTIGFASGTSNLVVYGVNGTESLPFNGKPVQVQMNNTNVHSNFLPYPDDYAWPTGFFSTACPFPAPAPSVAPLPSPSPAPLVPSPSPCPAGSPPSKGLDFSIPIFAGIVGGSAVGGGLLSLAARVLFKRCCHGGTKKPKTGASSSSSRSKSRSGRSKRSGGNGYLGESLLRDN